MGYKVVEAEETGEWTDVEEKIDPAEAFDNPLGPYVKYVPVRRSGYRVTLQNVENPDDKIIMVGPPYKSVEQSRPLFRGFLRKFKQLILT